MDQARKTAYEVLLEIEKEMAYSNLVLNKYLDRNRPENSAFVRELVYGVLENKILLDYYLNMLVPSGIKKVKKKEATILRMGLYQMLFLDSVPDYAAVNESVILAKKYARGRDAFVNGVLRGFMKRRNELMLPKEGDRNYLSVKYSFPQWIIDLWQNQSACDDFEALLSASNARPRLSIRVNTAKIDSNSLIKLLENQGLEVESGSFSERTLHIKGSGILDLPEYAKGLFSIQDEASTVAADLVDALPGDIVIDVCAAPGGKTCAIAEKMNNKGVIYSCDIYEHKLNLIKKQALRLGLEVIKPVLLDGTIGRDQWINKADKVLCDAPCSGLGVIRRKPEIKYKKENDFSELIEIQKKILNNAARYVKTGGNLVYSTCTINRDENQNQIKAFVEEHKEFEIITEKQFLPTESIDGFYICKMLKRGK